MRPQRASADGTRRALLDSGRQIFARNGYSGAGTQDIVDTAGVAPTALYHHFGSKSGLFIAVGQEVYEIFVGHLGAGVAAAPDFDARIAALIDAAGELHRSDPTLAPMAIAVQLEVRRDEELRLGLSASLASFQSLAEDVSRTAPPEVLEAHGLRATTLAVITLVNGMSSVGATLRDPGEFVASTRALRRLVLGEP